MSQPRKRLLTSTLQPPTKDEVILGDLNPDEIAEYTIIDGLQQREREAFHKVSEKVLEQPFDVLDAVTQAAIRLSLDISELAETRRYRFFQDVLRVRGLSQNPNDVALREGFKLVLMGYDEEIDCEADG